MADRLTVRGDEALGELHDPIRLGTLAGMGGSTGSISTMCKGWRSSASSE